jgi:starch synthase
VSQKLSVLAVASECYPLVKTGGLADVVGALPTALAEQNVAVTTLIPAYPAALAKAGKTKIAHKIGDLFGGKAVVRAATLDGQPLLLLDAPHLFARDGGPYADASGRDWDDNWRRFAALSRVAADLASGALGPGFDLLHAHDWQAALAPLYLRAIDGAPPSLITIHNIAFQGQFGADIFPALGLPPSDWSVDGLEYYGGVGFLKGGMAAAHAITTVSPTYAREIRIGEFGMGLEGLVRARGSQVHGILNGIDPAVWNPASDPALPAPYTAKSLSKRARNRTALARAFGLDAGPGPLFTVVSRLTWQKGMDVLADSVDALVAMGGRLAVLGSGDAALEGAFVAASHRHPGRVAVRIGYDEPLSHLMQGGGDAILIPSRFEPCGLTQLYGLAYGCVPVVARTGGLADTIVDANAAALANGVATGIMIGAVEREALIDGISRAIALFADPPRWQAMQRAGMTSDFSWTQSAATYAALYRSLTETAQ